MTTVKACGASLRWGDALTFWCAKRKGHAGWHEDNYTTGRKCLWYKRRKVTLRKSQEGKAAE